MQTDLLPSHKSGVGGGVGWSGTNFHVHVHTSPTLTPHLVILDCTSGVRWGWMGWDINFHVHVHTSSTLTSHLVILDDTSGLHWGWVGWGGVGWGIITFMISNYLRRYIRGTLS